MQGGFSLEYFRIIFQNPVCRQAILNSLLLGLTTTILTSLLAVPLAFVAARYGFRGKAVLTSLLLVPMIMPPFVGAIGMLVLARQPASPARRVGRGPGKMGEFLVWWDVNSDWRH